MTCLVPGCRTGQAHPGQYACEPCAEQIRRHLREIELYAQVLASMTLPLQGRGERRSTGYGSRSPARDDVIVALDYRSRTGGGGEDDEDTPTRSILGTLHQLGRWIREEQELSEPRTNPTVSSETAFLLGAIDWCTHRQWIDELARDIRDLHASCRRLAGDQPPRPIGKCPTLLDNGTCNQPLWMPITGDTIRCRHCGRAWARAEWERLAALLADHTRRAG